VLLNWRAHDGPVLKVVGCGRGSLLMTSGADRSVVTWDISGAQPTVVRRFMGFTDPVTGVAFRGDDYFCVVGQRVGLGSVSGERRSRISVVHLNNHKTRRALVSLCVQPLYLMLLLGDEDGGLVLV
jgi:WD40 repeat protein